MAGNKETRWVHTHLNPENQSVPVRLKKFSRINLAKIFRLLGYQKGAEVGVAGGHYSRILCGQIPNLELLCVDTWMKYSGNRRGGRQEQHDRNYEAARELLAPYNATLYKGFSMDVVRDVPVGSLDFVYIDGNHSFDYVMQDIIEWAKRVRRGGIISGHDHYNFRGAGVVEAVGVYVRTHNVPEWFLTNESKARSWFWVKR